MADRSWRDEALALLFQQMSSRHLSRPIVGSDLSQSVAEVAQRSLLAFPSEICALAALAPRATDAALKFIDSILRDVPRRELFDDNAQPCLQPRLLRDYIRIILAEPDGRSFVRVQSAVRGGSSSPHIVLISGVRRMRNDQVTARSEWLLQIGNCDGDDANGGLPYFYCSCRAFEYKHSGESYCKHIIASGLAIVCGFASIAPVSDEEFVQMLAEQPSTAANGVDTST